MDDPMDDDDLMERLQEIARRNDVLSDPRWTALAQGRLSEVERKQLEELASTSEPHRAALAAFTPVSFEARDRFARMLVEGAREKVPVRVQPPRDPQRRGRAGASWSWAGPLMGLVAAGLLVEPAARYVDRSMAPMPGFFTDRPPLPRYLLALEGGSVTTRGIEPEPPVTRPLPSAPDGASGGRAYARDAWFRASLDAESAIRDTTDREPAGLQVQSYLSRGDEIRPWNPPVTPKGDGQFEIAGPVAELFVGVPDGAWQIVVIIGRPLAMPRDIDAVRERLREPGSEHLQVSVSEIALTTK